jgi:MHS family alpha-ketoglutarate permease-like MFS transporter
MQKFLVGTTGFAKDQATGVMTAALLVFMLVQPAFGWLSDRVGRKPMLIGSFGLGALVAWPVFTAIGNAETTAQAFGLVLIPLLILSAYTSVGAIIKAELFPAHVRALGVALPYALANAAFGGTAEYAALSLKSAGAESGFYLYVSAVLAAGLAVAVLLPDTRKVSLIEGE